MLFRSSRAYFFSLTDSSLLSLCFFAALQTLEKRTAHVHADCRSCRRRHRVYYHLSNRVCEDAVAVAGQRSRFSPQWRRCKCVYTPTKANVFFWLVLPLFPFSLCCCLLRFLDCAVDRVTIHSLCFPFVSSSTGQQMNEIQDSNAA